MTTLDGYARTDLKECLHALADVTERYGFDLAIHAMEQAAQNQQIAYPDVVRATRMAQWPHFDTNAVDLSTYNNLIPRTETEVQP